MLANVAQRKGVSLPPPDEVEADPYDRWAALVREHLDMRLLYSILGLESPG
jgi:cobyric acid synthase